MEDEYFSSVQISHSVFLNKKLPERCTRSGQWLPLENGAMDVWRMQRDSLFTCILNFRIYLIKTS